MKRMGLLAVEIVVACAIAYALCHHFHWSLILGNQGIFGTGGTIAFALVIVMELGRMALRGDLKKKPGDDFKNLR